MDLVDEVEVVHDGTSCHLMVSSRMSGSFFFGANAVLGQLHPTVRERQKVVDELD